MAERFRNYNIIENSGAAACAGTVFTNNNT